VEELVARPVQTSDQYSFSTLRTLNVPASLRHVTVNTLEEVILERRLRFIQICFLLRSLDVAEVQVALKAGSLLGAETSKGSHSTQLVLGGHSECTYGAQLAVVLNC
jgi:hypothetical protein